MISGLGPAVDSIKSSASNLLKAVGLGGLWSFEGSQKANIYLAATPVIGGDGRPWTYSGQDWYKVFPYSFVAVHGPDPDDPDAARYTYTLPIPPQQMLIKMLPASAATATLGGVVEETSDNVFWIIQMAGTTGAGVSREGIGHPDNSREEVAKKFRKKLETTGLLSGVAAQVNALVGKAGGVADAVIGGIQSGSFSGAVGGLVGAMNTALLPPLPYSGSSVDGETNGFTEIQELHRFLYTFSKLKNAQPKHVALKFLNYKTNQEWRVILQDFSVQQSAQNPHLYRYNIQLKAWGVKNVGDADRDKKEFDRFGPDGDLKAVNTVGAEGLYKGFKALSGVVKGESKNTVADAYLKPLGG